MADLAGHDRLLELDDDGSPGASFAGGPTVLRSARSIAAVLDVPVDVYSDAYDAVSALESSEPLSPSSTLTLARLCREVAAALSRAITQDGRPSDGRAGGPIRAQASAPDSREALDSHFVFEIDGDGRVGLTSRTITLEALRRALPELAAFLERAPTSGRSVVSRG